MTDRVALALAACEGLSNEELLKRGPGGFAAMIERKRMYAAAARKLFAMAQVLAKDIVSSKKQLEQMQQTMQELELLDAPITDTSEANNLLAGALKKGSDE